MADVISLSSEKCASCLTIIHDFNQLRKEPIFRLRSFAKLMMEESMLSS